MTLPQHVQELAERVASDHGVEVLEATLRRQGRAQVLSVVLDADEPVEADVVEDVSKDLSRALDQADPLPGSYTLEVTTPGLDRPLHSARDFRRQRGHQVRVVRDGATVEGVVRGADDLAVTLEVDGDEVRVPLSDVIRGKVVLPW
jgi:ribosome maturation factor RimP